MPRDVFGCHNRWKGEDAARVWWLEARDGAQATAAQKTVPSKNQHVA